MTDHLCKLREALQDRLPEPEEPEGVLTGYLVIAEWSGGDGDRWLTTTSGDINDEMAYQWTAEGWLWRALQGPSRVED